MSHINICEIRSEDVKQNTQEMVKLMQGLVMKQLPLPSVNSVFCFPWQARTDSPLTVSMHQHPNTQLHQNKIATFRILSQRVRGGLDHGSVCQESEGKERIIVELQGTLSELEDSGFNHEENKLLWRFISKVYGVVVAQVAFCAAVSAAIILSSTNKAFISGIHPVVAFSAGLAPFLLMWPMIKYRKHKPLNFIMLAIFTMCTSIGLAPFCISKEKAVIQSLLTIVAAVLPITGYAIWGSVSGHNFRYQVPLSFSCSVIFTMIIVQLFYPLVSASGTLFAGLVGIVIAGFLVYDRDELIKRHAEQEYIEASICLYMDIIHVFHCTFHVLRLIVEFHCWFFGLI